MTGRLPEVIKQLNPERTEPMSSGSTGECMKLVAEGRSYFFKLAPGLCGSEYSGLSALAKVARVPKVFHHSENWILSEFIEPGEGVGDLVSQLVAIHKREGERFGFEDNGFIGPTVQLNQFCDSWSLFFNKYRLKPMAENAGHAGLLGRYTNLVPKVAEILDGVTEPPVLNHGDLWNGNVIVDSSGLSYFIDPAVSYGHRETDLAMMELFGGFPGQVFSDYERAFPLQEGSSLRKPIYQLYHALNHVRIFGNSYVPMASELLGRIERI